MTDEMKAALDDLLGWFGTFHTDIPWSVVAEQVEKSVSILRAGIEKLERERDEAIRDRDVVMSKLVEVETVACPPGFDNILTAMGDSTVEVLRERGE